jgi:glutamate/tyrosine decarboxylase-like PLP-dependent enzyme
MTNTPGPTAPLPHPALTAAESAARRWLDTRGARSIPAPAAYADVLAQLPTCMPSAGRAPELVIDELAAAVEPGLLAIDSPRFFGWVMGGSLPAALAADWLVSAWDQNAGMRDATPGVVAVEDTAGRWLVELLGLPVESAVGFVTGATMANFTALAAARDEVLARVGWDVAARGLTGPAVTVLVGAERHGSIDLALRYLGLGHPLEVAADEEGRMRVEALRAALAQVEGPVIVCAQAGNIHSGSFDAFAEIAAATHAAGGWLHIDGAFGLWAAASPQLAHLVPGLADADSWATDAHKTLNTPYDTGVAVVRDAAALTRAFGHHAAYLLEAAVPDPHEMVPEMSRRARGVPVWAALNSLGRDGVAALVDGMVTSARRLAEGLARLPGVEVLHDVVYTQVSVAAESDERTSEVLRRVLAEGLIHPSGSRWHDRTVIRFSVSNHATDAAAVDATVEAMRRALR